MNVDRPPAMAAANLRGTLRRAGMIPILARRDSDRGSTHPGEDALAERGEESE
jgi:hypothetical protein